MQRDLLADGDEVVGRIVPVEGHLEQAHPRVGELADELDEARPGLDPTKDDDQALPPHGVRRRAGSKVRDVDWHEPRIGGGDPVRGADGVIRNRVDE